MSEVCQRLDVKLTLSIYDSQVRGLIIKSNPLKANQTQLLVLQDIRQDLVEQFALIINQRNDVYALILTIDRTIKDDAVLKYDKRVDEMSLSDKTRLETTNRLLIMDIPTKYTFDEAINAILSWYSNDT